MNALSEQPKLRDDTGDDTAAMFLFRTTLIVVLTLLLYSSPLTSFAQTSAGFRDPTDRVRGTVLNSVTHEPISRALVISADNSYAALTDDRGHFEFIFPREESNTLASPLANGTPQYPPAQSVTVTRPTSLTAKKFGYLPRGDTVDIPPADAPAQDLTISLVPEARIVGRVILSGSDGFDRMQVALYRANLRDGREHWDMASSALTRADGQFRFADLGPGSYKILTLEGLDRDPLTFTPGGQLHGYPPLYYPGASDFATAATIQLKPGETFQPTMSPVKREYYPVNLGVTNAPVGSQTQIKVFPQGHPGPGYSLGFNNQDSTIQGLLPDGTYTVQATTYGPTVMTGTLNFTVKGGPLSGPTLSLNPAGAITVNVSEEFQHGQQEPSSGAESVVVAPGFRPDTGNQRQQRFNYLQLSLAPDDEFGMEGQIGMSPPKNPEDNSLVIENVLPGRYLVNAFTSRGYVFTIVCGGADLLRQSLVVGIGASLPPIEVTVRDDGAEVEGTIDLDPTLQIGATGQHTNRPIGVAYFVPVDRPGTRSFTAWPNPDGAYLLSQLPPGNYRVLALDHQQPELESANKEALARYQEQYPSKIQTLTLVAGQKARLRLSLITTE